MKITHLLVTDMMVEGCAGGLIPNERLTLIATMEDGDGDEWRCERILHQTHWHAEMMRAIVAAEEAFGVFTIDMRGE